MKSAVLLAALGAQGRTTVIEPIPTRDHTELMLREAGVRVTTRPNSVSVDPPASLRLDAVDVPGDFSSAAPFVVAATIVPESRITIHDVGLNPRRTGLLAVLDRMGARVGILTRRRFGQEPGGDLEVRAAELTATEIDAARGAAPDRRAAALRAARGARARHESRSRRGGATAQGVRPDRGARRRAARARRSAPRPTTDGFEVTGVPTRPRGGRIDARGDHRIAMLGAVAGVASREGVEIEGFESVGVSFPGFHDLLEQVTRR